MRTRILIAFSVSLIAGLVLLSACSSCSGSKSDPPRLSAEAGPAACECSEGAYGCSGGMGCACRGGKSPETECQLVSETSEASSYCCPTHTTKLGAVVVPPTAKTTKTCGKNGARANRAMVQYGAKKPRPIGDGVYGDTGDPNLDRVRHAAGIHFSVKLIDPKDAPKNLPPELDNLYVDVADGGANIPDRFYVDIVNYGAKSAEANCVGKRQINPPTDPYYGFQYQLNNTGQESAVDSLYIDIGTPDPFCDNVNAGVSGDDSKYNQVPANCMLYSPTIAVLDTGIQRDTWELNNVLRGANCQSPNDTGSCVETGNPCGNNADCCSGRCSSGSNKVCLPTSTACFVDDATGDGLQPGADYAGGLGTSFCHADPRGLPGPCSCPHFPIANNEDFYNNQDCETHGTEVASIIGAAGNVVGVRGVAPKAKILPVKDIGITGGTVEDAVRALMWLIGPNNPSPNFTVINMSVDYFDTQPGLSSLQAAIDMVSGPPYNKWIVASVNNDVNDCLPGNTMCLPARSPNVIAVAGLNRKDMRGDVGFFDIQRPDSSCLTSNQGYGTNTAISVGDELVGNLLTKAFYNRCNDGHQCRTAADCQQHGGGACNVQTCQTGASCTQWCIPTSGGGSGATGHTCSGWCLPAGNCPSDGTKKCFLTRPFFQQTCIPTGNTPDNTPWAGTVVKSMTSPALFPTVASGNSLGAPVVAAALALYHEIHPADSLAVAKAAMQAGATALDCNGNADCIAKCGATATDQKVCFGAGRLNIKNLLDGCPPPP